MHLFMNAMNQEPNHRGVRRTRYAVLRSTYPALKTTVVKSWRDWFESNIRVVYDVPIRGEINMPLADGTRMEMEVHFLALDREEDVNKLQSLELTGAHINEAAEIPKGIFNMLKTRVKRFPAKKDGGPTHSFIVLDYNSVDIDHWLYKIAEEEQPNKHSFYHQPPAVIWTPDGYIANPEADNLEHLPEGYYEDMVDGNDDDFINIFVLNNYGSLRKGRPVYKAYDDKVHASDRLVKPLAGVPVVIGMDVGLDPAIVVTQLSPTGQMIILDEICSFNTSIQEFAEDHIWPMIRNKYSKFTFEIKVDPAARNRSANDKRSAMDILVRAGLPVRLAKTNEPLARREAVNYFLRKKDGMLLSGPECSMLRKGFISEYKYEKKNSSDAFARNYKDKPEKNEYSHVHDALQYAALELSEGRTVRRASSRYRPRNTTPADMSAGY